MVQLFILFVQNRDILADDPDRFQFPDGLRCFSRIKSRLVRDLAQLRAADWLKFDMGQVYAMIAFSIFPVIIVYLILSKNIVGGLAAGAVKG